jgi:hypothetical protein
MDLLIQLLILVAIGGIIYWVLTQIPLPPPFKIVIYVIFALVAIALLMDLGGFGGDFHLHRIGS